MKCVGNSTFVQKSKMFNSLFDSKNRRAVFTRLLRDLMHYCDCQSGQFYPLKISNREFDFDNYCSIGLDPGAIEFLNEKHLCKSSMYLSIEDSEISLFIDDKVNAANALASNSRDNIISAASCVRHQLTIPIKKMNCFEGFFFLYRSQGEIAFSEQDRRRVSDILPFINLLMEHYDRQRDYEDIKGVIAALMKDSSHKGLFVLNESLSTVYVDEYVNAAFFSGRTTTKHMTRQPFYSDTLLNAYRELFADSCKLELKLEAKPCPDAETKVLTLRLFQSTGGKRFIFGFVDDCEVVLPLEQKLKTIGISVREIDVVDLVYQGYKNSEIAEKLYISEHTVENHLRAIYKKMNVNNRTSLVHELLLINETNTPAIFQQKLLNLKTEAC